MQIKEEFDKALTNSLKEICNDKFIVKYRKKGLEFISKENVKNKGKIEFVFHSKENAYYCRMIAWSEEFSRFIASIKPPYKSNVPEGFDHHFSLYSLSVEIILCRGIDGKLSLPLRLEDIPGILIEMKNNLNKNFIPWIEAFLNFSPDLINLINKESSSYSFPVPLMIYTLQKNNMKLIDFKNLNKKIWKDKIFDYSLFENLNKATT